MSNVQIVNFDMDTSSLEACLSAARRAETTNNFNAALQAWENIRTRFPEEIAGYTGKGWVLRQLSRLDEAESILSAGLKMVPGDEKTKVAHAWVAHSRGDLVEADRRWSRIRNEFPACFDGYFGGGAVLCGLRRFDEADAVYRSALARFPVAPHLLGDFAAVAQTRGDTEEASKRWTVMRTLFPDEPEGFSREARALRQAALYQDAERVLSDAQQRFPRNSILMTEFAQLAQERGFWSEALTRWDAVATEFHGLVDGYLGAAGALNQLGRYADAQTVLQPAIRMFPDSVPVASLNAWIAHYRNDFAEAAQRWTALRTRFPSQAVGYTGGAASSLAAGKVVEAAALCETAVELFPNDIEVAIEFARIPENLQDWSESLRRWTDLLRRFPADVSAKSGYAHSLMIAGKVEEAEKALEHAISQHGETLDLSRLYADCAARRRNWNDAEARWRRVMDKFPEHVIGWAGLGDLLRMSGKLDGSETLLVAALARFPAHADLERGLASASTTRRDWPVALSRWSELKAKYPQNPAVLNGITDALWQARQDLGVAQSDVGNNSALFDIPAILMQSTKDWQLEADALSELFMKFESIGDTCEFGMVQRRYGAEPISLLRWTSTRPDKLVEALNTNFAGVGEPEHTDVEVSPHGEYTTSDRRYHMFSHTFTPETSAPIEKFTTQHLRRMQYLRRKLVDDLTAGEKIFVYKCGYGLSDDEASNLFAAIRRYGEKTALLCVRLSDESNPSRYLKRVDAGFFVGYIDRFSTVDINVEAWVDLCRKAETLWDSSRNLDTASEVTTIN